MTIKVYWACIEDEWMLATEPESVAKRFYSNFHIDEKNISTHVNRCPAFNSNLKNLYALKSIYDYEFTFNKDTGTFSSPHYDEEWFNNHVLIRSKETKFFSFRNRYIFFTEHPSLNTTFYEYPYFEQNSVTNSCIPIAGQYDIGKWFRHTEFPFLIKETSDTFKIKAGDVYSYIRFHTDEKIQFIQFRYSKLLDEYRQDGFNLSKPLSLKILPNYYSAFKNKNLILKEIKNNLLI